MHLKVTRNKDADFATLNVAFSSATFCS